MRPELFSIPFLHFGIPSYGAMLVLGFITAITLAQYRCRKMGENPEHIGNFGVMALLAGVLGARLFHVFHHWSDYRDNLGGIFAVWSGGLEFLGGVIAALAVMILYFRGKKLPVLKFLDILAPALMLGLAFGRMGCFLNGCCFGAPCELPWAIRFPPLVKSVQSGCQKNNHSQYSYPFEYQLTPDGQRNSDGTALVQLPADYYGSYMDNQGHWARTPDVFPPGTKYIAYPKHPDELTAEQRDALKEGKHPMHPIHPAQIYSLVNALLLCGILLILSRRRKFDGQIFAFMLILYGISRYFLESLRTDSPLEFGVLTISQILSLIAVPLGIVMLVALRRRKLHH